ncbi:MAG: hypothetical protein HXY53_01350 [Nitrospirae bacterium]|nr:hypothetical protein [Nitrospirota bacterium]
MNIKAIKTGVAKAIIVILLSLIFPVFESFAGINEGKYRVALFPFDNFSEDKRALDIVMPEMKKMLEEKGLEVLYEEILNAFLLKERVRSTGYISKELAAKATEELKVDSIMVGSINTFLINDNPIFGISARLINATDNMILWAEHASATGEDFTTIFGLGTIKNIEELSVKVIKKMFDSFSTSPPVKEKEATFKIAVMPFQNKSKIKDAGMIVTNMFIVELLKSEKFEPLEYGDVQKLIVDRRVKDKGEIDYTNIDAIADNLGVDGIILGTVENYQESQGNNPPESIISIRLINARNKKILWSETMHCTGGDDILILDFGKVRSAENIAYKTVWKLVNKMGKIKWR